MAVDEVAVDEPGPHLFKPLDLGWPVSVQAYVNGIHEGKVSLVWKDLGVHLWNIVVLETYT